MMEFVYDVKNWKKWWSMRFLILSAFFQAITLAYATIPYDWMPVIPNWAKLTFAVGALGCAGLAGVSRVIQQASLRPDAGAATKIIADAVDQVEEIGR